MRRIRILLAIMLLSVSWLPSLARQGERPLEGRYTNEVLIIGLAARSVELGVLGNAASNCGVQPIVETLEEIRAWWPGQTDEEAIRLEVEWWFSGTDLLRKSVLLFGGWTRQEEFPQYREIPTWFVDVGNLASPDGLTASDQPYGDINGDGKWDVPVFRLITRNIDETNSYAAKVTSYHLQSANQEWQRRVAIHCDDRFIQGAAWNQRARELSLQLPESVAGDFVADAVILADDHSTDHLRTVLPTALEEGKGIIIAGPSVVATPEWLDDFRPFHFRFNHAPANSRWPLMLGYSCELARFQEYWDQSDDWSPYCRDFTHVDDYRKGPIAWMGPTSGSHQYVNFWLAQAQLQGLMVHGMNFGQSLLHATNTVRHWHPEATEALRAYAGIGAPWLKLHRSSGDPAGVSGETVDARIRLLVHPNPVRAGQEIRLSFSSPPGLLDGFMVFGPDGRLVRSFTTQHPGTVVWDLRDNDGRAVSSGVYFLKVPGLSGSEARKPIVIIR